MMRQVKRIRTLESQVKNLQSAVIVLCKHVGIAAGISDYWDWEAAIHGRRHPEVTIFPEGPKLEAQVALLYEHLGLAVEHNPEADKPYVVTRKSMEAR